MTGTPMRYYFFCALGAFTLFMGSALGDEPSRSASLSMPPAALPESSTVESIDIYPSKVTLRGADDARQLIVTATVASRRRQQDLTSDVKYEAGDPRVARVTSGGRIIPVANGKTEIKAVYGEKSVKVPVEVAAVDADLPINFGNQIVPIFTKLGCNSRRLPRQGQRPERLQALAARASSRRWITTPWSRRPAAGDCSRPRRTTAFAPAQGDRQHRPRRRQAHGGRLRRIQAHPPLDRRRHCPSASRRTRWSRRSRSTPSTAS